ncbi:hypothetical protein [Dyadobacter sp. CY347]|uniref:hypothetical protein n=1 Tax=Dyadobacter sp. CY347 TaxID=2909336 RepID=UPI001F162B5B|nr:hypothetical protein [Dyadobacter sp. CY347]MCF2491483.1 hypothetical protein [Dyadobacter sp. CY347]
MSKFFLLTIWAFFILLFKADAQQLIISPQIRLPRDSTLKNNLIASLKQFLNSKELPNQKNGSVLPGTLSETSLLLDEFKQIEIDQESQDSIFFKPYLINLIEARDSTYSLQLSYMGIRNTQPTLRACFKLSAKREGSRFLFFSPFKQNTKGWKLNRVGLTDFFYREHLNEANVQAYQKMIESFDKIIGAPSIATRYYCADNFEDALMLAGVNYKSDYNGYSKSRLTSLENDTLLVLDGRFSNHFDNIDPHDLFHERLHLVIEPDIINRPVDEGCAYLYGGSWGIGWPTILAQFIDYAAKNKHSDWLTLYLEREYFTQPKQMNKSITADQRLSISYVINALIVKKLEREKGFGAVKELLSCGKSEKGDANYFVALAKTAGITKANFNKAVWELIECNK